MLKLETVTEIAGKQSFKTFEEATEQRVLAMATAYYGLRVKWEVYNIKRLIGNWGVPSQAQDIYSNKIKY